MISSSSYSYIISQTGTETFPQDGSLPSVFQSNQPVLPSPASCSYADSHLGSSPAYLQNQSTPGYNNDHRTSLQNIVGVPQELYGNMAAEDLFFMKASQYGIQVVEKQSGCKDMKVEQVFESVKDEKANLFKTKASQNRILIESAPEMRKTLDFLPIAKEEKARDNNPNCSLLLDVQANTNASAIRNVQCYNNYGENVSNKFVEVDGESMAKRAGSIYSASWSAKKFTSISDTDNKYSKFAEQSRLSPTDIWMMDGKHEDISRDGSLEGIEQTVLDALNLQEVAWETDDDDSQSWEGEMEQEEKVQEKEEGPSLGVELEDEERIKEAAKCLVETIITGALKEIGEEEHFSKEEEKKIDYQSEIKADDYWSETKVDDYWSETKVDDYQSESKVDDNQSETKVDGYWSESKVDDYQSEPKVDDYQSETKVYDYWSESKVDDYWSETKVGDYWSEPKVGDYWSEIVTEGREISTTEEQSVAREIIVDSVIHTLDDPGSVGDDPGLMSANRSSEIEKNDFKENKVFQNQPQNKKLDSVLINDSLILKSTDGNIKGHTAVCASKVDEQFEKSFTLPPFCFEFNPELPEFKPGLKKIGDSWKKAYAINVDAPEEFQAAVTKEDKNQYADSDPFPENSWVVDNKLINILASDFQMKTGVGQEPEQSSATHKIVWKLNTDCPEFKPESQKISTIRPDAPEFTPSLKTFFQPPDQDAICKMKPKAKVLHLVTPKVVEKFKSVDIQASVEVKDSSSLTRKVKKRDTGTYTGSCDCRDVCVNTLESMACDKSKFYIPKEVVLLSTKSVCCGTEPQSTESIGINTDLGSYNKETELIEKLKQAQMELIQCRADLHVLLLEQTISKLKKEKKTLMEVFIGGEDKVLIDQIIDKRILKSRQEILNIEVSAKSWVKQIQMGEILDSVPALLFETETQGLRPAVGDFHQPIHVSPCKVIVSPEHGGFGAINIDNYKMDMSNTGVMASSTGPSLVNIKWNENTDQSPVDSIQEVHSVDPNGQFPPEIMVSQRHREVSGQYTSPHMVTIQHMGAKPRVKDSQTTNTLPVKYWWSCDENIEDNRKADKVQRSQSLVQKAEHFDKGPGKNDVKVQGSDVEVKIDLHPPWRNIMLDREDIKDVEVKFGPHHPSWHNIMLVREDIKDVEVKFGPHHPSWHNIMLDREGSKDVEVKSGTQPPWRNMMLDREGSRDVKVKSGTEPPWRNMMSDREGSSDVEVKSGTQPPWHNIMLDREGSEDAEVKSEIQSQSHNRMLEREGREYVEVMSDTQPPWYSKTLEGEGSEDVVVKDDTQPPLHNIMLDREGSEDVEVKSDTQPPWHNMILDKEDSEDVEVKSDTQPPRHNMILDKEDSEDVEVKSDTQPPWHNMILDKEGSEDVEVKSDTQPPWHNMILDKEGSEDVEVKSDTQPPRHNMILDKEDSEDVEVKSDTQPPWHNMMLDKEGSEDVEVKSDTQPPRHNMILDKEDSEAVEVKSDTQPPRHNMILDKEDSEDVEVKSDTQPPRHNMMLDREDSEDDLEGTQNDSLDRDRQLRESELNLKVIVNFNSALPIVNEKGVLIAQRISEGEISGSEKDVKKTTFSDFKENAVKTTLLGSDETLILAESVRKTEAVTDFQENKLSVCSSGFESMKVGSFEDHLETDQDTSNIKVIMDSEKDYVEEINSNSNNNDINVNSDALSRALKLEVSDFSDVSKAKDVSSNKSQRDPISTETQVHDLVVEDSHSCIGTGETVIVNNDVATNDLLPSNGHCSIAVDANGAEIISSLFRHEMPLGDSVGITDLAIISVSGSVSKKCSQISHASVNDLNIIDGISSQKSGSPSIEQQTQVVSNTEPTCADNIKTKTESDVAFNLKVGDTRVKTTPCPVYVESVLNLANEAVPNLDSGAGTVSGVLDPADAAGVLVPGTGTIFPLVLNPAEEFTPVPMPSLTRLFMPVLVMPQDQTVKLGMPIAPQRSTTSPPVEGMVLAAQKGIPDPAGGIMEVDPILYQTVLAQINEVYPDLSQNSEMLRSLALQQTTLLQFYISGGEGHFSLAEPQNQSSVQSQKGTTGPCRLYTDVEGMGINGLDHPDSKGTTGPCRLYTEVEGMGINGLDHPDSKESTDSPIEPLAPPPGNLPTSTLVSKGFDSTSVVESALKPIDGASSSVPTSELSFSFANTARSFTATAKIDTTTKSVTTHSNLHPILSITSKTDQVHSNAAQEDDAEENINSAAEIETSMQTRTSSSDCHTNELDVLHKNKELLIQDVESPKLSGSQMESTLTKPSGSLQNLHGASSNKEQPGQKSNGKKTLMPRPGQESNGKKQPGQESNQKKQPGQESNQKKQPGQESNGKKQPGQESNGKKQPGQKSNQKKQPGQESNGKKQPGQESNGKKTSMLQSGQESNGKKTLMPQSGHESNGKKTSMLQSGQESNGKKTSISQSIQESNGKKTLMPQEGQESNGKKTSMLQSGQESNGKKTSISQSIQESNGKKTLMPQEGQESNGKKTSMPQSGQESDGKKTLLPQPDFVSYPIMPPWAAQPSILQPRFGSNLMMPLRAAQPQIILSPYVKPNGLPNLLSPLMAQPRVFSPCVMQPQFKQHQPQKPHFIKPQHSHSSGWQHGFPQSTQGLPQNVIQHNFSSPADEHNDSTKGESNHNITRETSVPQRTPDSDNHNVTRETYVPQRIPDSDKHNVTSDTSVHNRTLDSEKYNVTSDTSVPHKTLDSDKHNVTSDTSVHNRTLDSEKHNVTSDTSVHDRTFDSEKHNVTSDTSVPHKTLDSDKHNVTSDTSAPHTMLHFYKHNGSGLCPITTHSTAFNSRLAGVGSDKTVSEPNLCSPFGSDEAGQPDFLPSFVKTDQYTSTRKRTPPVSKTTAIPELTKTQSGWGATSDARENWNDEVDEYPKPFKLEHNVKREITGFNVSYSAAVKPRDSKLSVEVSKVKRKNEETNSTNPWASQVQGHQVIVTNDENFDRKEDKKDKKEESWTEVIKKKKKDTSKQEPVVSTMTKLGTVSQSKASNFEKLIQKLMECFSNMTRLELIDVITQVRRSRGGSLSGMTMKDIVDKAGEVIMVEQHQRHKTPCLPLEDMENEEDICVICHDGLSLEETMTLDCGHIFHSQEQVTKVSHIFDIQ
ncbi:hypothetical protein ACJMK2_021136 [Sinanodonta woodiana]|uniref:TTC3/DZIP3/RBM44-like helical domain-containing protein n=1 Tax=Sinanodonta woodiana TaxID=1069815 RepID=A0ABD3U1B6_SINWO